MELCANPVDLAIIGAGPVGLFAAFYAGLRQMSVCIIDSLDEAGGQLIALYPEKYIYDVPGFPKVLAKDLTRSLLDQALQYGPKLCLGQQVRGMTFDEASRVFTVATAGGEHQARSLLITAGIGAFEPRRLTLPEAGRFEGRGLHYFVKRLTDFAQKRVLIVGGGDSAVDWANAIAPVASEVTVIHRRDAFRAHEDSVERMRCSKCRILTFHEIKSIGGSDKVESATVYDNRTKEERTLELDAVVANIGFINALGPIKEWGLELEAGQIKVDSMMRTARAGIFAAGDIAIFPGKLKLIATGFGEAAIAVNYAKHYLDPKANIFPGHSSNMKR